MHPNRPRHFLRNLFTVLALLCVQAAATAAEPADPAKVIPPFVDEQVLAVVRVDAARVNLKALESWLVEHLRAAQPKEAPAQNAEAFEAFIRDLGKLRAEMEQTVAGFTRAGGRDVFVVVGLADLDGGAPPTAVVPLSKDADAGNLVALFGGPAMAERAGDVILFGTAPARARLKAARDGHATRAPNPEMLTALAEGIDGDAVRIAVAPAAATRRAIEQLSPKLPPALGGGDTIALTRGFRWAAATFKFPPQPGVRAVAQSTDPDAAATLEKTVRSALAALAEALDAQAAAPGCADAPLLRASARLAGTLAPARDGDRVVLSLDERGLAETARTAGAGLVVARTSATRVRSMSNIRQLGVACQLWAAAHKGEWPDDLAAAMKFANVPAELAINPGDSKTGYAYVKPPKDAKSPATRIVIYDATPDDAGRSVGYMDCHSVRMTEDAFQRALQAQQDEDRAAGVK